MKCDFCLQPWTSGWVLYVDAWYEPVWRFQSPASEWAACDECFPLVMQRDLDGLVDRVDRMNPGQMEVEKMRRSYVQVFRHRRGIPHRVNAQGEPQQIKVVICGNSASGPGYDHLCYICRKAVRASPQGEPAIKGGGLPVCNDCGFPLMESLAETGNVAGLELMPRAAAKMAEALGETKMRRVAEILREMKEKR